MLRLKRCGFILLFILLGFYKSCLCSQILELDLEPIVVTKSKIHLLKPYSVEGENLQNLSPDSFIESLGFLPVDLESRSPQGGVQTDFSIRGSNFQGVQVLLDGQRINDPQTAHHNSDIPLTNEDIERVDVIPGVSSSVFGPDAIGGAINFVRKKPAGKKKVLELAGGSFNSGRGTFSLTDKLDNWGFRFSTERQESGGLRYDTDFQKFIATAASSLELPDGEFNTNFGYEQKAFGAFDFYTPGSGFASREWTRTYLLDTGLILDKGPLVIKPNFLWRRHYDKFVLDKTLIRSLYLNHHRTDIYMPSLYLQGEAGLLGRLGFGSEYRQEKIDSTNLGNHARSQYSLFIDDSKDIIPRLSMGSSLRWDEFSTFGTAYSGSVNFKYRICEENDLTFGISRSIRIPSFTELFYSDPTTLGNTDLSEERSLNYQAGYNYKKENFGWGMAFFLRQENKFIDWVKRTPGQEKWQVENITSAEVSGIEAYFRKNINRYLNFDSNYTFVNRRVDEQGLVYKYGENFCRHLVNILLNFNLPAGVQTLTLTYKKKPNRRGWLILDLYLSRNLSKRSSVFLRTTNLLNVEFQEIVGISQPGRWIEAGFRLEW